MPTTVDELFSSEVMRITGQDEAIAADVVTRTDGKNSVCVDTGVVQPNGGQAIGSFSNNFKYDWSGTSISLGATYTTVYSCTGKGLLVGFSLDCDSATAVAYELVIDGKTVFTEVTNDFIRALWGNPSAGLRFFVVGETILNQFDFQPPMPISFNYSVSIRARRTSGTARNILRHAVVLTKEP